MSNKCPRCKKRGRQIKTFSMFFKVYIKQCLNCGTCVKNKDVYGGK